MVPARKSSWPASDAGRRKLTAKNAKRVFTTKTQRTRSSEKISLPFVVKTLLHLIKPNPLFINTLAPFASQVILYFVAGFGNRRKLMAPIIRHAGVDQAARAVTFVLRRNAHVEGTARRAADDFPRLVGVASCGHRPKHVERTGRIDVFVHHHDEASVVGAAERLRG